MPVAQGRELPWGDPRPWLPEALTNDRISLGLLPTSPSKPPRQNLARTVGDFDR